MGRPVPVVSGPLAPYAAGFEGWLTSRGYALSTVGRWLWQLDQLSRWLERRRLAPGELTPERVEEFLRSRRAAGRVTLVSPGSMALPLAYLREVGAAPVPAPLEVAGPLEELLAGYRRYLVSERGATEWTFVCYAPDARLFLSQWLGRGGLELERLTAADVSAFLARECPRRSVPGARRLVTVLRSLLRYLHVAGLISAPLDGAVLGVANLRDSSLPRGLEPGVVARLLSSCDRRTTVGQRDYAILLLLVRLGLRACEVAALELNDLDWRSGEILIRGKGGRLDRLPLPAADVGEALVAYLRCRGRTDCRAVFLRALAPAGALSPKAVGEVVRSACRRAELPSAGSHRLRHTAATGMLRAGAPLREIAEVLRQNELQTAAIYAKVDRTALRAVARPWPEVTA